MVNSTVQRARGHLAAEHQFGVRRSLADHLSIDGAACRCRRIGTTGHIVVKKDRIAFLRFLRYIRSWDPPDVRIVLDNFSPHLSTKKDKRVGEWAAANNVELAYTPTYSSWLNRIEAQFQALRYFTLDGTDHASHREQASMIRRYIHWRNRNAHDRALRELIKRANVA